MTVLTDKQLGKYIKLAKALAEPHGLRDVIKDGEAHLAGKPALLPRYLVEQILERKFRKQEERR